MDIEYKGLHSIVFFKDTGKGYSKRHSWNDFHMIPTSRPYVALGSANYSQVVIPGTSNRIDITDVKPGGLTFGPRTGTWEFYIDHTKWPNWADAHNTIKDYIHGGTFLVNLTDDPLVLYQGILTISGYVAGENYSKITIQYDLMYDTVTLDEPIDFGDFGKLPDPKIRKDGDDYILDLGDGDEVPLKEGVGFDTNCDGKPDVFLPKVKTNWPNSKWILEGTTVVGLDINDDDTADYYVITDSRGITGIDKNCDGKVDIVIPGEVSDPDDLPDPDDVREDIPQEDVVGYDTDCDDVIDITIDKSHPFNPVYVYDDGGNIVGFDCDGDGIPDYYVIEVNGKRGLDLDCDGALDKVIPDSPGDPTVVIGAYYPLTFVYSDGTLSSSYGFASVSKSTRLLGVYNLYTIYEDDKVTTNL